ncbi:hypothetical protein [Cellulomonas sp. ATA003]|uniref:HD domain-containing protein n=1 Tax=Cellulomonas sp. ATA003 TaxID=3073064 RepID=UPI002873C602|nr:hypothetical protein [Cellulomonas sp. ATA003]WNB85272.1 hypothetical protein REH70_16815 [Cellulomonas sp. ATA003]
MGVYDAPQWLLSAWSRSCEEAGATASAEEIRTVGGRLLDRWSEPGRHFHNLKHLVHVLSRVDELAEETHEPDLVRLAAWYHGAIFDAAEKAAYANRGGEDEVASADLARAELTQLGVPERNAGRVAQLVTALARHLAVPGDFDCAVLCDADLAVLAAEPQRYKAYLKEVRAEYAHVPVEDYLRARSAILTKLQQRPALFTSPLGTAWEGSARQNVAAELHRIHKELAAIDAATPPEPAPEPEPGSTPGSTPTDEATATGQASASDDAAAGAGAGVPGPTAAEPRATPGASAGGDATPTADDRRPRRGLPTFGRR